MATITAYLADLRRNYATGEAREHAYRPALRDLLEALRPGAVAVNDPRQTDAGAVDFIIKDHEQPLGWLEAKDLGADLGKVAKSDQLARYLGAYPNLVLTNYLEFRFYLSGKEVDRATLGYVADGKLKATAAGEEAVEKLLRAFLSQQVYRPGKPADLARRMAFLARMAEAAIAGALRQEGERGQLHTQLAAFRETLLPDLGEDAFADMYAQTLAYGLFAAKCHHPLGDDFTRWTAGKYLPPTNPFLRRLFHEITGPDLDEAVAWVVDELVSLLRNTDMSAIVEAFAKHQQGREDPVVHFYETFLKEYNPKERKLRGVYYTPEPVVSYIVRSVDHLLKTEFDKPLGLADPEVFILDPACGTGTFLYFVIEHIHQTIAAQQGAGAWAGYVRDHLLKRLFGFELLMAPYTIAHLKLAQQLKEQGYDFPDDQRLGIFLTNTLEDAWTRGQLHFSHFIDQETRAARDVKRDKPIVVVLGNPPYAGHSANDSERVETDVLGRKKKVKTWIGRLMDDYRTVDGKPLGERNPKWLQDDYVKFIRFGQWRIEQTGHGILAFITNHGYLDNPTFRGMRQQLLRTFPQISVLDLHGNAKRKEVSPDGSRDENVFDIQQGVAVGFLRRREPRQETAAMHAEIWGCRAEKYEALESMGFSSSGWTSTHPESPAYSLKPAREAGLAAEYDAWDSVGSIIRVNNVGVVTGRDRFAFAFGAQELGARVQGFLHSGRADADVAKEYLTERDRLDVARARHALAGVKDMSGLFTECLYRPFDTRCLLYCDAVIERSRRDVMRHLSTGDNIALVCPKRVEGSGGWKHVLCSESVVDHVAVSLKTIDYVLPLYTYPEPGTLEAETGRRPNLDPKLIADLEGRLGWSFIADGEGDLQATFGPEDVFHYIYAVLHSPTYRTRYAEFLKIDFPRIPLTSDRELFRTLCGLGKELVGWHLLKATATAGPAEARPLQTATATASFPVAGDNVVEAVRYDEAEARVYINKTQYFSGIGKALYEFQVGGYQVLNKWLKDRKGRQLSYEDLTHYMKVAAALTHTMRLMAEIDAAIPGWPLE